MSHLWIAVVRDAANFGCSVAGGKLFVFVQQHVVPDGAVENALGLTFSRGNCTASDPLTSGLTCGSARVYSTVWLN